METMPKKMLNLLNCFNPSNKRQGWVLMFCSVFHIFQTFQETSLNSIKTSCSSTKLNKLLQENYLLETNFKASHINLLSNAPNMPISPWKDSNCSDTSIGLSAFFKCEPTKQMKLNTNGQ